MDLAHLIRSIGDPLAPPCEQLTALAFEDRDDITYGQLRDDVQRAMGGLVALGVRPGDRVALLLYNSIDYWRLYFAITSLGAIAVKLNWRLSGEELEFAVNDSDACLLIVNGAFAGKLGFMAQREATVLVTIDEPFSVDGSSREAQPRDALLDSEPLDFLDTPWPDDTPAAIMYTSGTTGRPKGAVWSHGNAVSYAAMQSIEWGFSTDTVSLTSGPFYHVGAFENLLLPTLLRRGTAVFMQSTGFSVERCARVMAARSVDRALLYPFMINDLVGLGDAVSEPLRNLRMLVTGGSAIAPPTVRELQRLLPDVALIQTYGLTEGGAISTVSEPLDAVEEPESTGRALALTEVKCCVDESGTPASPGEVGEVWVRSPSVSGGYWQRPTDNASTFINGWCRTGDLGRITPRGRLQITGRLKDMIRPGGENVYPAELERVLSEHPAVADIAVIGVPDERFEEAVCAVVVTRPGVSLDEEEFRTYARSRLAGYKVPKHIVVVDELPRTASGKVQKFRLRDAHRAIETGDLGVDSRRTP